MANAQLSFGAAELRRKFPAFGVLLFFGFQHTSTSQIVAAGEGEGGEGGGGSIEVGVSDPTVLFGFAKPQPASFIGDEDSPLNNARVETDKPESSSAEALLPPTEKTASNPDA
ncbi:MAG: hypothetical protein HC853_01650, partial [Anaerolineae bacterium]|nr:hypothetical protein [Anaerolineae bacterium]